MVNMDCQNVLACRFNFFGSIAHRGGRDARVPVLRRFAANLYSTTSRLPTLRWWLVAYLTISNA
ncbi:MAG: hypothetical protein LBQ66_07395 [Planctomycetaceae bacterium]|nr:hypothetical protein [Planctomycetaceae bacterium]